MSKYSLLCFNISSKDVINTIGNLGEYDLCFIQEIPKTKCTNIELPSHNVISLMEQESSSQCNCLCYKDKFDLLKIDGKDCRLDASEFMLPNVLKLFKAKLPDTLKRRACLAILKCKDTPASTGIIVASFHNPSRQTDADARKDLATKLFSALENLRQMTGYPVLVGGDFNCELLKDNVERSHFIVPQYSPTIHRVLYASGKGKICIDFFAYKNCDDRRACLEIQLTNVEAKMLPSSSNSVLLKGIHGEDHLDHKEYQSRSILRKIHAKSNHDPLRATLTIKKVSPIYRMSCIFMNDPNDEFLNEIPISDFLLFHNINKDFKLPLALPTSYDYHELPDIAVKLYCDNNRLQYITTNTFNVSSLTYLVSELKSKVKDDQTIFVALFYQRKDQSVTKECVEKMFKQLTTTCNNSATWIIGNVDINENVKTLKLPNISTKQLQGRGNNYFCACMNDGEFSNVHFETIPTKYLEMNTAMKLFYNKEEILNGDLPFTTTDMHCLVSVLLDPGKPLQETYNSQNKSHDATLPNKPEILCFNMGQVAFNDDESMSKIKCYFTKLDPKPNLFILQNSPADTLHYFTNKEPVDVLQKPSQTSICKALGVEESHDACCRSTIVYDKIKFKLVSEIRISSEFMITACILTYCTIDKNIIVASFHNSCTQKNTKIEIAEECFKVLEKLNMKLQYPVLVAGGFYIELDKEHKVKSIEGTSEASGSASKKKTTTTTCNIDRKGFIVPPYNPLLHRVLHKVINHREDACIDTFAYKSSNTYAIELNDVNPEAIDPCPSLVTGAYNIDYDKVICNLPEMITEHDPIRAKMIIKLLPTVQASTPMQQTPPKPPPTTQSEYTPTKISTKASKTRRKL